MMNHKTTRAHIVEAADQLFYQQGFTHTSFANIADTIRISRGNFYYHFKSKDDILGAVIKKRLQTTQNMLKTWEDTNQTPEDCIRCYLRILLTNRDKILLHGCPVGTLCGELAKLDHGEKAEAIKLFDLFRVWLRKQFTRLGHKKDADRLAMRVLAWSQGVATLANAYNDKFFVEQEVHSMCDWLESCTKNPVRS